MQVSSLDIIIELIYYRGLYRVLCMVLRMQGIDLHAHYMFNLFCFVNQVFPIDHISSDQIRSAYLFLFVLLRTTRE